MGSSCSHATSRVGLFEGDDELVLRADSGEPQLFDLSSVDPDLVDFGETLPPETTRRRADLRDPPTS